jgi:hypothetical protein
MVAAMTASPASTALPPTAEPDVARLATARWRRRAGVLSLAGAGVVTLAGFLVEPWGGRPGDLAEYQAFLAAPTRAMVAAVLLHVGYLLFVPAAFALLPLAVRRGRRLAHLGIVCAVLGAGESGILVIDFYNLAISRAIGAAQAVALGTHQQDVLSGIALIAAPSTFGLALGAILLAFAIWRARVVALWIPVVTTAGMVGLTLLGSTFVPAVASCVLLAVGLLAQAWALARTPDVVYASGGPRE